MGKSRKPALSLASAIHRTSVATGAASVAAPVASNDLAGRKRKRQSGPSAAVRISQFHQIQRRRDELAAKKASLSAAAYAAQLAELDRETEALGGLEAYQSLSIAGHSSRRYAAFNTAHWIVDVLADAGLGLQSLKGKHLHSGDASGANAAAVAADEKKLAKRQKERERKRAKKRQRKAEEEAAAAAAAEAASKKGKGKAAKKAAPAPKEESEDEQDEAASDADEDDGEGELDEEGGVSSAVSSVPAPVFSPASRLRMLDVGAITNHYLPYASHIACDAIDLNPQHASVRRADFFELDFASQRASYDAVVLSLVLNFVGDRFRRGEMIKRSVDLLKTTGHARLFVVLPSACLKNSRWINHSEFIDRCMRPLGMRCGKFKYSTKLAFFEFIREEVDEEELAAATAAAEAVAADAEAAKAQEEEAEEGEDGAPKKKALSPAAAAAAAALAKKTKKKGFQPAGIVLAGETRNNFSIAWRADN